MILRLPLRLRSIEVNARIAVEPCGAECLLQEADEFSFAVPGGMALALEGRPDGTISGVIFGTERGTYIKAKAAAMPSFGAGPQFTAASHRRALDALRSGCCPGICRPLRECGCSLEFAAAPGAIAWAAFSMHAPRLAELYPVHRLETCEQAFEFVRAAWTVLSGLNRSGISHGDPAFYNFVMGPPPVLIDLDCCAWTGESESVWDQSVFVYSAAVPVLAGFLNAGEIAAFLDSVMHNAEILGGRSAQALIPAIAQTIEYNRSSRLARGLAMQCRALNIQLAETERKLNGRMRDLRAQSDMFRDAADERLRALLETSAELDRLRRAEPRGRGSAKG